MAPTVVAAHPFDANAVAESFASALKHVFGADDKAIIKLLVSTDTAQRLAVVEAYKTLYGKDLVHDLKHKLGGNLEETVVALLQPHAEYDAAQLRKAMKGLGTDEEALIEILTTRTDPQIHAIRDAYSRVFHRDLDKDLESETSGKFKHILVSLAQGNRDETGRIDQARAQADAEALHKAGEGSWFTDGSTFNRVFMSSSPAQLRAVSQVYQTLSSYTLSHAIHKELSGSAAHAYSAILDSATDVHAYFAERLYRSMHGVGTDDVTLIRVIVSRAEVDMQEIKREFEAKYGKSLAHMITGDCSGDYKHLLLALIGEH